MTFFEPYESTIDLEAKSASLGFATPGDEVVAHDVEEQPAGFNEDAFAFPALLDDADDVIALELFNPEDDESDLGGPASHGSLSGTLASVVFHVWLIVLLAGMTVRERQTWSEPELDTRMVTTEIPDEPDLVIEYDLANPDDKELEVREVLNATSVGISRNKKIEMQSEPEPFMEMEIDPERARHPLYDIPEGIEVDERLVVKGTTGDAIVQIESALDRVTWEIASNLQERKVLVVWLLDASGSLETQRKILAGRLRRIYGELDALEDVEQIPRRKKSLLTGVVSFGQSTNFITDEPTGDFKTVLDAVSTIEHDPSGRENIFTAVSQVMKKWSKYRIRNGRRIMIITVTDESGDDFEAHEQAIVRCRRYGAKAYVIGPAAVFGRRKGYVPYVAPENGRTYQLPVDLGPETASFDLVDLPFWYNAPQYKYLSSGFGPYALARLVKETGGVYFMTNMTTMAGLSTVGVFDSAVMKSYAPDYRFGTPNEYIADLRKHPIRYAVWLAARLSRENKALGTPSMELRVTAQNFRRAASDAQRSVAESQFMIEAILQALPKNLEKEYEQEPSARWRLAYSLAYGRLLATLVRCYEYNFACANLKGNLTAQDVSSKANHWIFKPDHTINYATSQRRMAATAMKLLQRVVNEAPGTPWAVLASRELRYPLGIRVIQRYIPPPPPRARNKSPKTPRRRGIRLAADPRKSAKPKRPAPKPVPPKLPAL